MRHDRALVGVDGATLAPNSVELLEAGHNPFTYSPDGKLREHCKLFVLSQMPAVLAMRGGSALHQRLHDHLRWAPDIEEAIALLEGVIRTAPRGVLEFGNRRHEVRLIGRSRGQMVAARVSTDDGFASGVHVHVKRLAPGETASSYGPHLPWDMWSPREVVPWRNEPSTPEEMLEFAKMQCAYQRDPAPGEGKRAPFYGPYAPFGGRLVVAEITEAGITVSVPGDLGAPPAALAPISMTALQEIAGAMNIVANAATETVYDTDAGGTITRTTAGATTVDPVATADWTNTQPSNVTVQTEAAISAVVSGSHASPSDNFGEITCIYVILDETSALVETAINEPIAPLNSVPGGAVMNSIMVRTFVLQPGWKLTVKTFARLTMFGGASVSMAYNPSTVRISAIKR